MSQTLGARRCRTALDRTALLEGTLIAMNTRTRFRRATGAVAAVALAAGVLAACAPTSSASAPASHAADAGLHMISNDGHRLAFHVTPGHRPAVVLDAGGGNDSTYWKKLVPVLSQRTGAEIITYDRAGMGKSDRVPGPYGNKDAASDLEAGLKALEVSHDAVLVSHSQAGEVATNLESCPQTLRRSRP